MQEALKTRQRYPMASDHSPPSTAGCCLLAAFDTLFFEAAEVFVEESTEVWQLTGSWAATPTELRYEPTLPPSGNTEFCVVSQPGNIFPIGFSPL